MEQNKTYKFIDLFAGIGGLGLPFREMGWKCVFSSEIDKFACQTYEANFNEKPAGDITKINPKTIPDHDLLLAGFPCQPFSIAGHRKGFDDERGNLFFNIVDILKVKKPQCFLLENVKNLVSHDGGNTFKTIKIILKELGYSIKYKILNAKDFDSIQNRERIYIVGFLQNKDCLKFNFIDKKYFSKNYDYSSINWNLKLEDKYYYTKTKYNEWLKKEFDSNLYFYQIRRKYIRTNKNNLCPTLTANMGMGGHNVPIIYTKYGFRKLTPRECFNIQGFPTTFKLPNIADSHLYKQAGNSVSINCVKPIATKLLKITQDYDNHKRNIQQNYFLIPQMEIA